MRTLECQLCSQLKIEKANRDAYKALARYHYRNDALGPIKAIYAMHDEHPLRRNACAAVGVIVYGSPAANSAMRNLATGGIFAGVDRAAGLALLNASMLTIRRVIIEPRYRGLGLASRLVRETMPLTGAAMIEAAAVMGRVHPFLARAGMTEYAMEPDVKTERMRTALETVEIGEHLWNDAAKVHACIERLDADKRTFMEEQMRAFVQKFATQRNLPHSPRRTEFVLSKLGDPGRYYLWLNPKKCARPKESGA
ncbi:MAG: hypothetical protein LLF76_04925 [Planctomycetaceae bacterium]|nr:hypothetical protein [Planctomycetaceae bacterium]